MAVTAAAAKESSYYLHIHILETQTRKIETSGSTFYAVISIYTYIIPKFGVRTIVRPFKKINEKKKRKKEFQAFHGVQAFRLRIICKILLFSSVGIF